MVLCNINLKLKRIRKKATRCNFDVEKLLNEQT